MCFYETSHSINQEGTFFAISDLFRSSMLNYIEKFYENGFKEIFTKNEYYEYLVYTSRNMTNYKKYMLKYKDFEEFVKDIIKQKIEPYFLGIKDYLEKFINKELEYIKKNDIKILNINNPFYPKRLKEIKNPPSFIFYKGNLSLYIKSVAVVGTRNNDRVGEYLTIGFTREIVTNNINIVSGSARGIDTISQKEAIKNNGSIIIVTGVGLASFLETYQGKEYLKTEDRVLFLTEFPLFFTGNKQSFPIRNRIISGLSLATIMIQAPIKSGALYTANYALLQNKPLFIPMGEYFNNNFEGNLELLKRVKVEENIYLLIDVKYILKVLKINNLNENNAKKLKFRDFSSINKEEIEVLSYIQNIYPDSIHFDKLFNLYNNKNNDLLTKFQSEIFNLMLNDFIDELPGKRYIYKE
jgi:DNA processing protein